MAAFTFIFIVLQILVLVSQPIQACPIVYQPQHGRIQVAVDRSYYRVTCDPGYIIHGPSVVYCERNQWNSHPPTCIQNSHDFQTCPYVEEPRHGSIEFSADRNYYRVTCDPGYIIHGQSVVSCEQNQWNSHPPTCIQSSYNLQTCPYVDEPRHGRMEFAVDRSYYSVSCNPGYIIHGPSVVYCEQNQWNSHPPTCIQNERAVCETLSAPKNGRINCDAGPLSVGKACHFSCFDGYELKVVGGRRCLWNLKWSGIEPECIPISSTFCTLPPPLKSGTVTGCSSQKMPRVHGRCGFKCNTGYTLHGPSSLTCTSSGKFVDDEGKENFPVCAVQSVLTEHRYDEETHISKHGDADNKVSPINEGSITAEFDVNPCKNLGGCQHICKAEQGRARCRCRSDFILAEDGRSCIENSQSELGSHSSHSERTSGSRLPHGTEYKATTANEEHGSSETQHNPCENHHCEQLCMIENGRAQCRCRRGYILDSNQINCNVNKGPPIHPRNPCHKNNGGCQHKCLFDRSGKASCTCREGYQLDTNQKSCTAVSQRPRITCDVNNGGCEYFCDVSGYHVKCSCPNGYRLHADMKHCIAPTKPPHVTCSDNNGGCEDICSMRGYAVQCSCRKGYILDTDRKHCVDVDECSYEFDNNCQHYCQNTEGSYTCSCKPGYVLIDNHECEGCRKNSYWSTEQNVCVDCPANSYTDSDGKTSVSDCRCYPGFYGNPEENSPCGDIDECDSENFGCSHICVNIPGDAFCSCPAGYMVEKDNKTCTDIDECSVKNGGCEGHCHNTNGSFYCKCPEGFMSSSEDQYSCHDVDECLDNNGGCQQLCINFRGGYYCSCEKGYRVDSGLKNCTDIPCPRLPVPHFSTMICKNNGETFSEMDNYPIGTVCTFNCFLGFKNSADSNKKVCQEDGNWKGTLAVCKAQRCPPVKVPENGEVHPASCSVHGNTVKQKCTFTCHPGYKLKDGKAMVSCKNNLTWNTNQFPVCRLEEIRPTIECTRDVSVTLGPGQSSQMVTLPEPVTNMESYMIHPDWVSTGKPVEFSAGVTEVTYTATSSSSNSTAKCVTAVNILDKEPPVFLFCPDNIKIEGASGDGQSVTWEEPLFIDNVKVESVNPSLEPNSTLTPGSYVVEYIAKDAAGNSETCTFSIDIIRTICGNLTNPFHGEANCMDWLYGKFCQPECENGYMRNPAEPQFYSCDDTGVWEPNDIISECLPFLDAVSSQCPDGMEFISVEETGEEICLECPPNTPWSAATKQCEETSR